MGWHIWTIFAAVCAWQASAWLLPYAASERTSVLLRMAAGCALMGVAMLGQRHRRGLSREEVKVTCASILVFAVPAILLRMASEYSSETMITIVFAFAPVVAVLVWSAEVSGQGSTAMLVPALAAAAGLLLILPFALPSTGRSWQSFAVIVVAMSSAACGGVWLHLTMRGQSVKSMLALAGVTNAIALLVACWLAGELKPTAWGSRSWIDVMVWAGLFATSFWLCAEMTPIPFAARFLVVPLLTILEGVILLHPEITGRLVVGIGLLLAGTAWLLVRRDRVDEEVLSLR